MQARVGDLVRLRDGRLVFVTDASDGTYEASINMPRETIFLGSMANVGLVVDHEARVASDESEVVSILN